MNPSDIRERSCELELAGYKSTAELLRACADVIDIALDVSEDDAPCYMLRGPLARLREIKP